MPLAARTTVVAVPSADVVVKWGADPREAAALSLVARCQGELRLCPTVLGVDEAARVLVMERLPPAPSLATLLLGDDEAAARRALTGFGRCLGRLSAVTLGHAAELGPERQLAPLSVAPFLELAAELGVALPAGLDAELNAVEAALAEPGPWLALVHGDPCPDNTRVYGDEVVLIDFERAGPGHALIDGVYGEVPFPTCWCLAALDAGDRALVTRAYRKELAPFLAVPEDEWARQAAFVTTAWFVRNVETRGEALGQDEEWGTCSVRQRLVHWAERLAEVAAGELPTVAGAAAAVAGSLRRRWPDLAPLPHYPALGTPAVATPDWWEDEDAP